MSVYAHTVAWGRRPRLAPELSFRSPECGMFGRHLAEKLEPSGRSGGRTRADKVIDRPPAASCQMDWGDGAGWKCILLKNSSHPEDLAAALPIVSRITPDGYGVQAQVLKQLILFTMMKKTMNGTCSKLKIEIIPKTHRVVRLEIIQQ